MSKNIVVFSDGTGQEGGKAYNTNVYKLFNMIEDRTPRQIAFYDRGLGTGWRKLTGSAFGAGISANIRECYEFIFDHYQAGDQVFLFGFQPRRLHSSQPVRFYRTVRDTPEVAPGVDPPSL